MTREYAELSLKIGFVAAAIDNALNTAAFETATRIGAWEFSDQYYEELKRLAIDKGCPPQVIRIAEEMVLQQVQDEDFMAEVMREQERRDAEHAKRFNGDEADADTGASPSPSPRDGRITILVALPKGRPTQDGGDRHEDFSDSVEVRG